MALPASEIEFWRDYYSIFPFPQERADARAALIAQTITNMSGKMLRDNYRAEMTEFLPDYLGERALPKQKEPDEMAFVGKLLSSGIGKMEDDHSA